MITIIFAPPRKGKTVLMTHFLNEIAYNRERIKKMQKEILSKQLNGFNVSIPEHCASSNYDIEFRKFGYSRRYNYEINPFRLGYKNEFVKTHYVFPYQAFGITEGQNILIVIWLYIIQGGKVRFMNNTVMMIWTFYRYTKA